MKLRTRLAKAWEGWKARPSGAPLSSDNVLYVANTVTVQDETRGRCHTGWGNDLPYILRGVSGTAWAAACLNATVASSVPLRLFASAKSKPQKSGFKVRPVSRKRRKFLAGECNTKPHRKTMEYAGDEEELVEVVDHPIVTLLREPDPNLPGVDTLRLWFLFKELTGRAYAWMADREGNEPTSLYNMWPQFVAPMADKKNYIYSFWYGRDRTDGSEYPAEDMLYLREWVDPQNPLEAMSWLHSVTQACDMENAALTAEIARWNNSGQPGMIFTDESGKMTDAQMKAARSELEAQSRGVLKSGSALILKMLKLQVGATKPHEMNYEKGLDDARSAIWLAAGIPPTIRKMDSSNKASAAVGDPWYTTFTIAPKLGKLACELNDRLLPEFAGTEGMHLCFDNPTREDDVAEQALAVSMFTANLLTRNETFARMGEEPLDGPKGDEYASDSKPVPVLGGGGFGEEGAKSTRPPFDFTQTPAAVEAARARKTRALIEARGAKCLPNGTQS